jgi:capsid protein
MDAYLEAVASLEAKARKTEGENSVLALAMQDSVERVISGINDEVKAPPSPPRAEAVTDAFGAAHGGMETVNKVSEETTKRKPASSGNIREV